MAKYYALIREVDHGVEEDRPFKYDCEVVGWQAASGFGGNTVEECIASAKDSILQFKKNGEAIVPTIKVVEFEVNV